MADNQLLNDNNDGVGDGDDVFVYTGGDQEVPRDVKRVRIAENVDTIPASTFSHCEELIEVGGHNKIKKIERNALNNCTSLRRVIKMTGVTEIGEYAFFNCFALSELEFDKLEIIGEGAFAFCKSLEYINMSSIRRVGACAFMQCVALTDAVFGEGLERIEMNIFFDCTALRSIVIPLKDNLIIDYAAFNHCENFSIDVVVGGIHESISSLHLESWRNEMEDEIDSINQTLPNIPTNERTQAIQRWIARVFGRMLHYRSEHKALVKEAITLLELALWKANLRENDASSAAQEGVRVTRGRVKRARKDRCITSGASIVIKNVLPFLALK